jgi:hypothetical protein
MYDNDILNPASVLAYIDIFPTWGRFYQVPSTFSFMVMVDRIMLPFSTPPKCPHPHPQNL